MRTAVLVPARAAPSWETDDGRKTGLIEEEREGSQSCKKLKSLLETPVWLQTERRRRIDLLLYLLLSL